MPDPTGNPLFDTPALHECLRKWQAGDRTAADDLLRGTGARLEKLARRMFRGFPNVRGLADTADVFQNSVLRLLRTLLTIRPETTRDFFNLAAVHIRRELLDLARRCRGKTAVPLGPAGSDSGAAMRAAAKEPASPAADDFDLWVNFHEAVDALPAAEREVVGLVFYHGWTQGKIANLFKVDERTIRRRWSAACQRLRETVGVPLAGS